MKQQPLPLAKVTVADFSSTIPGPLATRILGQLGATVWKVEPPGGDPTRAFAFHDYLNGDKRSVELDLKTDDGLEMARHLAASCDIVVEGFRPAVMCRFGLDYDSVGAENPGVIYCSISGFGQSGPRAASPGHDLSYMAIAGLLGRHQDLDGRQLLSGLPFNPVDVVAGLLATIGILAALQRREGTGRGEYIDVDLHSAALLLGATEHARYAVDGTVDTDPPLSGLPHYRLYETADGRAVTLAIAPHEDHFWRRLCVALSLDGWEDSTAAMRRGHHDDLEALLTRQFAQMTLAEAIETLDPADIPWGPVLRSDEVAGGADEASRRVPGDPAASIPIGTALERSPDFVSTLGEYNEQLRAAVVRSRGSRH